MLKYDSFIGWIKNSLFLDFKKKFVFLMESFNEIFNKRVPELWQEVLLSVGVPGHALSKDFFIRRLLDSFLEKTRTVVYIFIHSMRQAYIEFGKSVPGKSSSSRSYNNQVKDTQGHG